MSLESTHERYSNVVRPRNMAYRPLETEFIEIHVLTTYRICVVLNSRKLRL